MSMWADGDSEETGMSDSGLEPVLVVGAGASGLMAAKALHDLGLSVTIARTPVDCSVLYWTSGAPDAEDYLRSVTVSLAAVKIVTFEEPPTLRRDGSGFSVRMNDGREARFGCVFLAGGACLGSVPRELSGFADPVMPGSLPKGPARIAFLLDWHRSAYPAVAMTAMDQAIENVASGGESHVFFRHAPVCHLFGEALYEKARRAGVQFYRFGDERPVVRLPEAGESPGHFFVVAAKDAIEGGEEFSIPCDRILVATGPDSSSLTDFPWKIIGGADEDGLALSSSIHCHSGRSFSSGVFVVGEITGELDLIRVYAQAAAAAVQARAWMLKATTAQKAVVVSEECIRCLTCRRICPHAAISFQAGQARSEVLASPAACHECGICVSECPRTALDLVGFPEEGFGTFLDNVRNSTHGSTVVVYGCQRSPARAASTAMFPPHVLFLSVPCAGRVSEALLWATLAAGARGVLVLGCHSGNCASETGTDWAAARLALVLDKLGLPGHIPSPVGHATVSSIEPARMIRIVEQFCESLTAANYSSARSVP